MGEASRMSREDIRVLLADDHAIVRSGVAEILNHQPGITVAAQAADGAEVDLRMPALDGVHVVEEIRKEFPDAVIVILTTYDTDDDIERALRAGAKAYLLKDVAPGDLVACVRAVRAGRRWVSPAIAAKLADRLTRVQLTPREMDVLRLLAAGKANREIAETLFVSEGTVKIHITHLYEKLGVTSRTTAISTAVRRGLVRID
jgi:DNA-binding NarL/FixJ family response regulator